VDEKDKELEQLMTQFRALSQNEDGRVYAALFQALTKSHLEKRAETESKNAAERAVWEHLKQQPSNTPASLIPELAQVWGVELCAV
jgi:hypothetical protein